MVNIQLPDETAAILAARASAAGLDLPHYLEQLAGDANPSSQVTLDRREWLNRWQQLVDSMPGSVAGVDDSRESIYDDRR